MKMGEKWRYRDPVNKLDNLIEARIPFGAIAVQAEVKYNQIGKIESPQSLIEHSSIDKCYQGVYFTPFSCKLLFLLIN